PRRASRDRHYDVGLRRLLGKAGDRLRSARVGVIDGDPPRVLRSAVLGRGAEGQAVRAGFWYARRATQAGVLIALWRSASRPPPRHPPPFLWKPSLNVPTLSCCDGRARRYRSERIHPGGQAAAGAPGFMRAALVAAQPLVVR